MLFAFKLLFLYFIFSILVENDRVDAQEVASQRQRRHRGNRAQLIRQYLKKNGRLEGMVRLVDGTHPNEGQFMTFFLFLFFYSADVKVILYHCVMYHLY